MGEIFLASRFLPAVEMTGVSREKMGFEAAASPPPQNPPYHAIVKAWQEARNIMNVKINWQFTADDARIKLIRLYPTFIE